MAIQFKQTVALSGGGSFQADKDDNGVLVLTLSDGQNKVAVKLNDSESQAIARDLQFILLIIRDDAKV